MPEPEQATPEGQGIFPGDHRPHGLIPRIPRRKHVPGRAEPQGTK